MHNYVFKVSCDVGVLFALKVIYCITLLNLLSQEILNSCFLLNGDFSKLNFGKYLNFVWQLLLSKIIS